MVLISCVSQLLPDRKKTMLEVGENFVVLNMAQNVPANNMFKKFTCNTSQRNWSVVFSQTSVAFLENWCKVSQRPVSSPVSRVKIACTIVANSGANMFSSLPGIK